MYYKQKIKLKYLAILFDPVLIQIKYLLCNLILCYYLNNDIIIKMKQ